jgi:predicted Zn-dependent protease
MNIATPIALASMFLLAGCAATSLQKERGQTPPRGGTAMSSQDEMAVWNLDELARADQDLILLRNRQGIHGPVETRLLRRILEIGENIVQAAGDGPRPEFAVVASEAVNAYAFVNGSRPTIAISLGMIRLLTTDESAWAALYGHELAHLRLDHIGSTKVRRERAEVTSSVAGAILSVIGLPLASVAADATAALADRAYSRDDEHEADRIGLQYMRRAGFSDAGAISLQQRLLTTRGGASISFLSTHPSGEQRIENLRQLMRSGN